MNYLIMPGRSCYSRTAARPYFDEKTLEMMVETHTKGTKNYLGEINKAMTVELLHRVLIDT